MLSTIFLEFGTMIEDSLIYLHSNFGASHLSALVPPIGQFEHTFAIIIRQCNIIEMILNHAVFNEYHPVNFGHITFPTILNIVSLLLQVVSIHHQIWTNSIMKPT